MILEYLKETTGIINISLNKVLSDVFTDHTELVGLIKYSFDDIGLLIRPALFRLGCELQGFNYLNFISIPIGIEIMQSSTLVLDDIIDSASKRNNKDSIVKKVGVPATICVGSIMSQLYIPTILNSHLINDKSKLSIIELLNESNSIIYRGQYDDIYSNEKNHNIKDYISTIQATTASFLANSLLAGYATGNIFEFGNVLKEYGLNLGIAFQIRDDILDFVAEEGTGKELGADIREKKLRIPIILLLSKISVEDKEIFESNWNNFSINRKGIRVIINLLLKYKIEGECKKELDIYAQRAINSLKDLPSSRTKKLLSDLVILIQNI